MSIEDRILEPGRIEAPFEAPFGEIRFLSLARRDLFTQRADRFRFLSPGHPLGEYLDFLALLADAQQEGPGPASSPAPARCQGTGGLAESMACRSWTPGPGPGTRPGGPL